MYIKAIYPSDEIYLEMEDTLPKKFVYSNFNGNKCSEFSKFNIIAYIKSIKKKIRTWQISCEIIK